jgi:hypothetical protein
MNSGDSLYDFLSGENFINERVNVCKQILGLRTLLNIDAGY